MEGLSSQGAFFHRLGCLGNAFVQDILLLCILRDRGAVDSLQVCGTGWGDPSFFEGAVAPVVDRCHDSGG